MGSKCIPRLNRERHLHCTGNAPEMQSRQKKAPEASSGAGADLDPPETCLDPDEGSAGDAGTYLAMAS